MEAGRADYSSDCAYIPSINLAEIDQQTGGERRENILTRLCQSDPIMKSRDVYDGRGASTSGARISQRRGG
jgi:hypothetical protein